MHYSSVLASVALVAVACAAPVADSGSSKSSASRTSTGSSHLVTIRPSDNFWAHQPSVTIYPTVTPHGKSSDFPVAAATNVPYPIYYGTTDSDEPTYKFDIAVDSGDNPLEDTPSFGEEPSYEKIAEAPFTEEDGEKIAEAPFSEEDAKKIAEAASGEEGAGDDTTGAKAVEFDGGYVVDKAFDTAEAPVTEAVDGKAPEATYYEVADNFDGKPVQVTGEEPTSEPAEGKAIGTGPAGRKHCK